VIVGLGAVPLGFFISATWDTISVLLDSSLLRCPLLAEEIEGVPSTLKASPFGGKDSPLSFEVPF